MSTLKLYSMAWQDRSDRVRWLLEELNVSYENIFLSKKKGELSAPEYLKLNPMGRVPTIVDGDTILHESAAICLHLADKYRDHKQMAPPLDHKERADYLKWMVFSVGSLEAVIARMFYLDGKSEEVKNAELEFIEQQCEILARPLNLALSQHDYLLPSGFSAADIMVSVVLPGAPEYILKPHSPLREYMKRISRNPQAQKVKVFEGMEF